MSINNSRPQCLTFVLIIIVSFLILAQNVKSVSFTFPSFEPYTNDIAFEGDAFASNGALYLTSVTPNHAGRASYTAPVRLWDANTGKLNGFVTAFYFVVEPSGPGLIGDGIAFFLAPFLSNIPKNSSGGYLGLFNADSALDPYKNHIVAVEFDTFRDSFDPPVSSHIGIDVNTIASVETTHWETGNLVNGFTALAIIEYEPVTKNLTVVVRYPGSHVNGTTSSLSYVIDLRTYLPEWVRVGFSGATGELVEIHKILSWTFISISMPKRGARAAVPK